ncbi:RecX family transcriptional regulator [Candidatus Daviesbacteria bacterium]|nr:RecX family transcriptional regulator [Candidatus Daviesbacteria bacterium]
MPKITAVQSQKKNPHRFNIYLDGKFAFGADEDLVVDKRLVVGKEISTQDVEQLIKETETGKLMERMYRLFSIRQRSEKEVRDYFRNLSFKKKLKDQQEISSFIIETAVKLLKRKGMINDLEFAKAWVESRRKKKGPLVIKNELYQKGIDREIIDEVISGQGTGYSEDTAYQLLEKKMRLWLNLSEAEFRKKSYEFLLRRGFEYEVVKNVVENFIKKR